MDVCYDGVNCDYDVLDGVKMAFHTYVHICTSCERERERKRERDQKPSRGVESNSSLGDATGTAHWGSRCFV